MRWRTQASHVQFLRGGAAGAFSLIIGDTDGRADVNRRHRGTRGDWQIGSWLLPSVPGARDPATGKAVRHSAIGIRCRDTLYRIVVTQGSADDIAEYVKVDGIAQMEASISLVDDKREHAVEVLVR